MPDAEQLAAAFAEIEHYKALCSEKDLQMKKFIESMPLLEFTYVNWQGTIKDRTVRLLGMRFGTTEWYPKPCWLIRGLDVNKNAEREFNVRNMRPPGGKLVIEYDYNQTLLALAEISQASNIVVHTLLEQLRAEGATVTKLGGACLLLNRNEQRLDHVAQRLGGKTDEPFVYRPPQPPEGTGTARTMG